MIPLIICAIAIWLIGISLIRVGYVIGQQAEAHDCFAWLGAGAATVLAAIAIFIIAFFLK